MSLDYENLLDQINLEHDSYLRSIDDMNDSVETLFKATRNTIVSSTKGTTEKKELLDAYKRTYFSMLNLDKIKSYNFQKKDDNSNKHFINSSVLDKICLSDELEDKYELDKSKLKDLIDEHMIKIGVEYEHTKKNNSNKSIDYMIDNFTKFGNATDIVNYLSTRTNIYLQKNKFERLLIIHCFEFYAILIKLFTVKDDLDGFDSKSFLSELRHLINKLPATLDTKTKSLKTNIIFFVKILQLPDLGESLQILNQIEKSTIISRDIDQLTTFLENFYYDITPNISRESSLQLFIEASLIALDQVSIEIEAKNKREKPPNSSKTNEVDLNSQFHLLDDNQFSVQLELPSYLSNFHETLTCPIDHKEMNLLANPATILGCGHIFGQSTIKKLLENFVPNHEAPYCGEHSVTCPYCNVSTQEENARTVQYLNLKEQVFENFIDYFVENSGNDVD